MVSICPSIMPTSSTFAFGGTASFVSVTALNSCGFAITAPHLCFSITTQLVPKMLGNVGFFGCLLKTTIQTGFAANRWLAASWETRALDECELVAMISICPSIMPTSSTVAFGGTASFVSVTALNSCGFAITAPHLCVSITTQLVSKMLGNVGFFGVLLKTTIFWQGLARC